MTALDTSDPLTLLDPSRHFCTRTVHAEKANSGFTSATVRSDELFRQANDLYWDGSPDEVSRLGHLFGVGRKLQQARDLLGDLAFKETFRDRYKTGFSYRSGRRYMCLARHEEAIRAAGLTRVMDAEELASKLDHAPSKVADEPVTTPTTTPAITLASENERRAFNDMRRLPAGDQSAFMADLVRRLTRLQSLFA